MNAKKFLVLALLGSMIFAGTALAAQPEDALSSRPEDSVYFTLRLEDTSRLLKWVLSSENLKLFLPLAVSDTPAAELAGIAEFVSKLAEAIPVRSAAVAVGITHKDVKSGIPFVQAAFTVAPEVSGIIAKIEEGTAKASDIAELLAGDKTAAAFFETMIKVEPDKDNILKVNGDVFMTAKEGVILVGSSLNEVRLAIRALNEDDTRLFAKKARRFEEKDFALFHIDYDTAAELDDGKELEEVDPREYMAKPLDIELAFNRTDDKFTTSIGLNLTEALKKEYADAVKKQLEALEKVPGGNITVEGVGGKSSPLAALGSYIDLDNMKSRKELSGLLKAILRNLRVRFGISEEEASALFSGKFSAVLNNTVTFEGFKIPALYMSFTGKTGAAGKAFDKLSKSQHLSPVQDGILQVDTSISPVACLVQNRGETLGVDFAELASLEDKPELSPAFEALLNRDAISSMWVDFTGIQSWLLSPDNGIFTTLIPLMSFMGYGVYMKAFQDVLSAEFSVPSMSMWAESVEVIHTEFAVKDVEPDKGLFATAIRVYQDFMKTYKTPSAPAASGDKAK